jgi:hypothetical protein
MPIRNKRKQTPSTQFWGPQGVKAGKSNGFFGFKHVTLWRNPNIDKISKRNLTWPQAQVKYPRLNPFGDADRDGKLNMFDCRPFNPFMHGKVPLYKQDATRFAGNPKNRLSNKQRQEQRKLLRDAGYPNYVVQRIASWHGPKVREFIAGKRSSPAIYPDGTEEEYRKVIGNPQKVKEFFDRVGKDAPEYIRQRIIQSQSQKNRYDQESTKMRERSNKWKAAHKEELKEKYNEYMEENRDRINKEKRENYDPEKRLKEFLETPKEIRVAKAAAYYQKVREQRIQDNKDVNKIIKDAGDYDLDDIETPSAQDLIDEVLDEDKDLKTNTSRKSSLREDLNSSKDKD